MATELIDPKKQPEENGIQMLDAPNVHDWMTGAQLDFMNGVGTYYKRFIEDTLLNPNETYSMEYFPDGLVSCVARVNFETEDTSRSIILKSSYKPNLLIAQTKALNMYAAKGFNVSKIIGTNDGKYFIQALEEIPHSLLSWISTAKQRTEQGVSFAMGKLLAQTHITGFEGYGSLDRGDIGIRGKFASLEEQLQEEVVNARSVMLEMDPNYDRSKIEKIRRFVGIFSDLVSGHESCLVNLDLTPTNLCFDGNELTIIDPKPKISHPYIDLAQTVLNSTIYAEDNFYGEAPEIIKGYSSVAGEIDGEAFFYAMQIMGVYKMQSIFKRKGFVEEAQRAYQVFLDIDDFLSNLEPGVI